MAVITIYCITAIWKLKVLYILVLNCLNAKNYITENVEKWNKYEGEPSAKWDTTIKSSDKTRFFIFIKYLQASNPKVWDRASTAVRLPNSYWYPLQIIVLLKLVRYDHIKNLSKMGVVFRICIKYSVGIQRFCNIHRTWTIGCKALNYWISRAAVLF